MRVEEVKRIVRTAPHFSVEIEPPLSQTVLVQNYHHSERRRINIRRKLIGVPPEQEISAVRVDASQLAGRRSNSQFVLEGMARKRRMVCLDVQLKIIEQIVFF